MVMGILGVEEVMCELMSCEEQGLPPGFRFHPTDEELIAYYLASKVFHGTTFSSALHLALHIPDVDLNRCEPWDLPEVAKMGEREWYFFSLRDRKYPTGLRTNRATGAGYWKATGKDREVYSTTTTSDGPHLVGLKKTLVFYKGRAPRGQKTKWVMHEYRLLADGDPSHRHSCKEEWVMCRIFHKAAMDKNKFSLLHQDIGELSYFNVEATSSSIPSTAMVASGSTSLPPLLETSLNQNPFDITHQQTHHHHHHHQLLSFEDPQREPSTIINGTNPSESWRLLDASQSMFFKSLLSHQDSIFDLLKDQSCNDTRVLKQCKTEAESSSLEDDDGAAVQHWLDKVYPNPYQNQPLLFHNVDHSSPSCPQPQFGFSPPADHAILGGCYHLNMLQF